MPQPDFIKPTSPRRPLSFPSYKDQEEQRRNEEILTGVPKSDSPLRPWDSLDQNVVAIWEVATEVMYINGWTESKVRASKTIMPELVRLVINRFRENGWMINPRQAETMRDYGLIPDQPLGTGIYIEMATDKELYVTNCIIRLFNAPPRTYDFLGGTKDQDFDPNNQDTWPQHLNVLLDPALRPSTFVPERWKAGKDKPPKWGDDVPMLLVPFLKFFHWFYSLRYRYQMLIWLVLFLVIFFVYGKWL